MRLRRSARDLESHLGARAARRLTSGANRLLERHPWSLPGAGLGAGAVLLAAALRAGGSAELELVLVVVSPAGDLQPAVTRGASAAAGILFPLAALTLLFGVAGLASAAVVHSFRRRDK